MDSLDSLDVFSLEEILLAVHTPCAGEAAVSQQRVTVRTFQTLSVPVSVQNLQDELIQDRLTAARTLRQLYTHTHTHTHR